jgi:hypothetical protein
MRDELWLPREGSRILDNGVGSATFSLALLRTTASLRIKDTAWRSAATRCTVCTTMSQPSRALTRDCLATAVQERGLTERARAGAWALAAADASIR